MTDTPSAKALLALMCFQSSRLEARANVNGEAILFDQQGQELWDQSLIEKGNNYLVNATNENEISKYHLETSIAYWHTTPLSKNKWPRILQLYNQLILIEYSPITALNRTFAFAKVYGHQEAIPEAKKLNLTESNDYHGLLGYLYDRKAIDHYEQAIKLTKSNIENQTLKKELERLNKRTSGLVIQIE